jgi:hypothetical protein
VRSNLIRAEGKTKTYSERNIHTQHRRHDRHLLHVEPMLRRPAEGVSPIVDPHSRPEGDEVVGVPRNGGLAEGGGVECDERPVVGILWVVVVSLR